MKNSKHRRSIKSQTVTTLLWLGIAMTPAHALFTYQNNHPLKQESTNHYLKQIDIAKKEIAILQKKIRAIKNSSIATSAIEIELLEQDIKKKQKEMTFIRKHLAKQSEQQKKTQ